MTLKASKTLKTPFIITSQHLFVGAAALTILATTSALWAQAVTPTAPVAPNMGTAAGSQQPKPLSVEELVAAFTKADVNKDSKLSRQEAENVPGLAARFDQIDANADKFVSKVEFENAIR